jgi:5-(carboxyamino)imidazole ribonucleotide mutase
MSGSEQGTPRVGIIMGSQSDWATMRHAAETLDALAVPYEARIVSAHRTPQRMADYAATARDRGIQVIVAGAGGAAHLPGMVAAQTTLPVLGVPVESKALGGLDSLLSIVQMPAGVPVGTLAIGRAGAVNAALLAASILANADAGVAARLAAWRHHLNSRRRPARPHDGARRRPARLPLPRLCPGTGIARRRGLSRHHHRRL